MYVRGETSGQVLNRAVFEVLESRRLLSISVAVEGADDRAPELTDEEIAAITAEKEAAAGDDSGEVADDLVSSDGEGEIRIFTMTGDDGEVIDAGDGEVVDGSDGEVEITMVGDDGSSPCPEVDDAGDPLYCILESNITPAPAPTLTDGILTVTGTAGDDKIRISIAKDTSKLAVKVNGAVALFSLASITKIKVDGLAGDDNICIKQAHGGIDIATELNGGDGDDKISGGDGNDLISGGAGKDKLRGNAGDDVLSGGDGNDKLFGGRGNDSVLGGDGADKVRGGGGSDVLDGSKGRDRIRGGNGSDHSFDGGDTMIDANKNEKSHRFARPIWWTEDDGSLNENPWWGGDTGDLAPDPAGTMLPIWWDPENPDAAPPDDVLTGDDTSSEEIVIDDGSGTVPDDSPSDVIMY
ncbi:MAG TPA: calcium-binding protein [Tepidisphaeraceae bacterium]|jgi:Ca2+-binding RTX toxin-like protein|nr:calcium-binding protein [Tepidisphaeraceae bacterium]